MNFHDLITFVIVEPARPENVGLIARAIKTNGFGRLSLVKPCEYRSGKAKWAAHGSADILDNAQEFDSLPEALQGVTLSIATTARERGVWKDYLDHDETMQSVRGWLHQDNAGLLTRIAVVFGREDSGLSNMELSCCDIRSSLPLATAYPSFNLAQAVLIYAWELAKTLKDVAAEPLGSSPIVRENTIPTTARFAPCQLQAVFPPSDSEPTPRNETPAVFRSKLSQVLEQLGIAPSSSLYARMLERALQLQPADMNLAFSFLERVIRVVQGKSSSTTSGR